jgi:hypothetical protein
MQKSILALALGLSLSGVAAAQTLSSGDPDAPQIAGAPIALGATSISQQTDNAPGTGGAACGDAGPPAATTENSFYRRFYLNEYGAAPSASVTAVQIAIRDGNAGANPSLPITVNLYTIPASTPVDTIPLAALTQIGTGSANVSVPAGNVPTAFTIPVTGTIADTTASNLVVEWTNGVGATNSPQFFPANNTNAETHPSFIRAPGCSINAPVTFASINFPSAVVMVVEGTGLPVELQQFQVD